MFLGVLCKTWCEIISGQNWVKIEALGLGWLKQNIRNFHRKGLQCD